MALSALVGAMACGGIVNVESGTPDGKGAAGSPSGGGGDEGPLLPHPPANDGTMGAGSSSLGKNQVPIGSGGYVTGAGGYPSTSSGGYPAAGGAFIGGVVDAGHEIPPHTCASTKSVGDAVTPNALVLLDRSASMSCDVAGGGNRWLAVETALTKFLYEGGGRSLGIEFFGTDVSDAGTSCNPADYEEPDVEVGPLPDSARQILDSFSSRQPGGDAPITAALVGAYNHIVVSRGSHPDAASAVVLVTDGSPDACVSSVADAANAASVGAQNGITTFVIGLVDSGHSCKANPEPANAKDLDAIAMAGGSMNAFMVDLADGPGTQLVDALNKVQLTTPVLCTYQVPEGPSLDLTNVTVRYKPSGAMSSIVVQSVARAGSCDPKQGGWYYDEQKPSQVDICPASCSNINAQRATLNIDIGCAPERL